jgi:hypothetical protein
MAGVPGKGIKIAGQDYCYGDDRDTTDLDLGPSGLTVENSKGGAGQNDVESRISQKG